MKIKYVHTNIITRDWKKLADFYQNVFGCTPVPPVRDQQGDWLDKGLGLENARLQGAHLRLPGYGDDGPTLEIYQYDEIMESEKAAPNRRGYGHIAFQVEDVEKILEVALNHGASRLGSISRHKVEGVGSLTFIYIADPDGNIIELQNWS